MRQIGPGFTGVADHIDALNAELSEARARITELEAEAAAASTDRYDWLTAERAAAIARAEAAEAQVAALREALTAVVRDFDELIEQSEGVAGLHLNGDIARWGTLAEGGRFEAWTAGLSFARAALADKESGT